MNASWPLVFGALAAGTIVGVMSPVRPEIRDVPALTKPVDPAKIAAAAPTEQQASAVRDLPRAKQSDIRKIPLTQAGATNDANSEQEAATEAPKQSTSTTSPCTTENSRSGTPGCLDRSATVADPAVVVDTKRIDPVAGVRETAEPIVRGDAASPAASTSRQKVVSAPAQPAENAKPEPMPAAEKPKSAEVQQASANAEDDDPELTAERERPAARPERRRPGRTRTNLNDGIPTRVYLRGPDGRLYLAPEYRFRGPATVYRR